MAPAGGPPSCINVVSANPETLLLEHLLDAAQRLPGSLFVLDQREANVFVSVLTEADSRADRNLGFD